MLGFFATLIIRLSVLLTVYNAPNKAIKIALRFKKTKHPIAILVSYTFGFIMALPNCIRKKQSTQLNTTYNNSIDQQYLKTCFILLKADYLSVTSMGLGTKADK